MGAEVAAVALARPGEMSTLVFAKSVAGGTRLRTQQLPLDRPPPPGRKMGLGSETCRAAPQGLAHRLGGGGVGHSHSSSSSSSSSRERKNTTCLPQRSRSRSSRSCLCSIAPASDGRRRVGKKSTCQLSSRRSLLCHRCWWEFYGDRLEKHCGIGSQGLGGGRGGSDPGAVWLHSQLYGGNSRGRRAVPAAEASLVASAGDGTSAEHRLSASLTSEVSGLMAHTLTLEVGGRQITVETGVIGRQANGAVTVTDGETVLFTTVCAAEEAENVGDFVPLTVNYQERLSAVGRTSGGFFKREGRPRDHEVLTCRLIDRPLRPLMPEGFHHETQVLSWVLSYDGVHSTEPLAITAAGAAMAISDIPLKKPIAGVRVGMMADGRFVVNPTVQEMAESQLDLVLAGTADAVMMIEGYCNFLSDEQMLQAIEMGQAAVSSMCRDIERWACEVGKPKAFDKIRAPPSELQEIVTEVVGEEIERGLRIRAKKERTKVIGDAEETVLEMLTEEGRNRALERLKIEEANAVWGDDEDEDEGVQMVLDEKADQLRKEMMASAATAKSWVRHSLHVRRRKGRLYDPVDVKIATKAVVSSILRRIVVTEGLRSDGRSESDVRAITSSCGLLPRAHGSALFTRGETQALAVATLGGDSMMQKTDNLSGSDAIRFYLQYHFPPCSVGETGRIGPPNRREVGHGTLAQRALEPVFPSEEEFPYSVRLESMITESNGSSSMASVCGGCLALMDAGVPLKKPVSGIAMGLILDTLHCGGSGEPLILTDILGSEDALGDMDFKVAGDEEKVTAFQMDIKVEGINIPVLRTALARAREGRQVVLQKMKECSPPPRMALSPYAPIIATMKIEPSKVVTVIGSGGKTIRSIIDESGVECINVEDDGTVTICARNTEVLEQAKARIRGISMVPEVGAVYHNCPVKGVTAYGCFVEIAPGRQGLVHVSELSTKRVEKVEDFVKEGDLLDVKLLEINARGQLRLSCRAVLLEQEEGKSEGEGVAKGTDVEMAFEGGEGIKAQLEAAAAVNGMKEREGQKAVRRRRVGPRASDGLTERADEEGERTEGANAGRKRTRGKLAAADPKTKEQGIEDAAAGDREEDGENVTTVVETQ
ncbi:hypothetical protein CBR_g5744 [Chara braunii]|uniref:polyribonucleotide nucleotidyltransferase n=1 Tax=Chara braunii TaxID=69332 RepID=A0A388KJ89_CHABU|nr:hypothetical protein CBR_g5744 [Chara braunii]|eukprot:GBG70114.1 hypothetical protein CBR_g5744 [Chara braunii]